MITDYSGSPRYFDKSWIAHKPRHISIELKKLYAEMEQNPKFPISKEYGFYPRGYPKNSPGWG